MGDGDELKCNYLCIGAGTSTMSFVDTMLSSTDKSTTFIIVDKHPAPGGHWNVAYAFVTLHQPSGAYGVPSEPLGKVKNGREVFDPDDLATGAEVLAYYSPPSHQSVLGKKGTATRRRKLSSRCGVPERRGLH